MFTSLDEFFSAAGAAVLPFNEFSNRFFSDEVGADHICYKCGSSDAFEAIRSLFEGESVFLYQSIISGHRIAYIKLTRGLPTALGPILFLELSDQKPDGSQWEGFDHVEVYPVSCSYDEMVSRLAAKETVVRVERPHHTTDDVTLQNGFVFRCSQGPLIKKIVEEMN